MRIMVTQIIMGLKGLFVDVDLVEMFNGGYKTVPDYHYCLWLSNFCGINVYIPVNLCY